MRYYYRVRARNAAGTPSVWSNIVDSRQDDSAPQTSAGPLPSSVGTRIFSIPWTENDGANGSGLASVRLFYRRGTTGGFSQYGGAYTSSPIVFDAAGTGGYGLYQFYTIGIDTVGNIEAVPPVPDTETDVRQPASTSVGRWEMYR